MAMRIEILEIEESLTLHEIEKRQLCKASAVNFLVEAGEGRTPRP
jgi:hypothetical protein